MQRNDRNLLSRFGPVGIVQFALGRGLLAELDPQTDADDIQSLAQTLKGTGEFFVNLAWNPQKNEPYFKVAVAPQDNPNQLFETLTEGMGYGGSGFYFSDVVAFAGQLSGNLDYIHTYLSALNDGNLGSIDTSGGNSTHAAWVVEQLNSFVSLQRRPATVIE